MIDTSGSMAREGRLELVKDALARLVDGLGRGDTVAIVTFGDPQVLSEPTPATDRYAILDVIDRLQPGGSTNLEHGLRLGYELARSALTENGIDRVVLASDGVANVGLTDPQSTSTGSGVMPPPASSSSRSASGWATTTTCCSSSWPTRATASTRTSTRLTRPTGCSPRT